MFDRVGLPRWAGPEVESSVAIDPVRAARQALERVRKLLGAFSSGLTADPARLVSALARPFPSASLEAERLLALGWLRWLSGEWPLAEMLLGEALERSRQPVTGEADLDLLDPSLITARAGYWLARVRLRLNKPEAMTAYEALMRTLGGSPQATAWFVDLLWRVGRVERAEQVWKSLRANKKVYGCDEGPLLEARGMLRRGELGPAEKVLREAMVSGGCVWVERQLLLAWTLAVQRKHEQAAECLRLAEQGPYPRPAIQDWRALLAFRRTGRGNTGAVPPSCQEFVRGQQARLRGQIPVALENYRAASAGVCGPFARFALATLGEGDAASILAVGPGLFLAQRCRVLSALERFRHRECNSGELLGVLDQAIGYQTPATEHFGTLARMLHQRQVSQEELRALVSTAEEGPARRNAFRVALELTLRSPSGELLLDWAVDELLMERPELRALLARYLARVSLLGREARLAHEANRLRPDDPLTRLALLAAGHPSDIPSSPAGLLWQAMVELAVTDGDDTWRDNVRRAGQEAPLRGVARVLLAQDAAQRGDLEALGAILDDADGWRDLVAPPRFLLRSLVAVAGNAPPPWQRALGRWLGRWGPLGDEGAILASLVGQGDAAVPPPGVAPVSWLLHQAARCLGSEDFTKATRFTTQALEHGEMVPSVDLVREALPELQRRADAQALRDCFGDTDRPAVGTIVDMSDLLKEFTAGQAVLEAARAGNVASVEQGLRELTALAETPTRLLHHLAIWHLRRAQHLDPTQPGLAIGPWRASWVAWLRWLTGPEANSSNQRGPLLDHLLSLHRKRLAELLASEQMEAARGHWVLVRELPSLAASLEEELTARVAAFRDDLATEGVPAMREAMRYGDIPEGWRADYPRGLAGLRRLLSLDHDSVRLLTALVEVCGEWFLDLYHNQDGTTLLEQVGRYTPAALHLARLVADRPAELAARVALSDFYKFRGFVERDHATRVNLYREALRFNPANENARELLHNLGEGESNGQ